MQAQNFKEKLRKVMEYRDETQKSLAVATGVTPQCINGYLGSKERMPGRDTLVKLCQVLKVRIEYFTDDNIAVNDFLRYIMDDNDVDGRRKQRSIEKIFSRVQPKLMELDADDLDVLWKLINKML